MVVVPLFRAGQISAEDAIEWIDWAAQRTPIRVRAEQEAGQ